MFAGRHRLTASACLNAADNCPALLGNCLRGATRPSGGSRGTTFPSHDMPLPLDTGWRSALSSRALSPPFGTVRF